MKILLDENIDPRLKGHIISDKFPIENFSTKDMGWLGLKNGELLQIAVQENFDVFVSADKQLKYQQNLSKYRINIVVFKLLKNNFPNQLLKISDLNIILERIFSHNIQLEYFEL